MVDAREWVYEYLARRRPDDARRGVVEETPRPRYRNQGIAVQDGHPPSGRVDQVGSRKWHPYLGTCHDSDPDADDGQHSEDESRNRVLEVAAFPGFPPSECVFTAAPIATTKMARTRPPRA